MRIGLIACCVLALALPLSGCVTARDPAVTPAVAKSSGNWRVERQTDRVTGAPMPNAYLTARSSHTREPYPRGVVLQLTCFKEQPLVRFAFDVRVGSTRNSEFSYRFDAKPGRTADVRVLQDYKTVVIEDGAEVTRVLDQMTKSETLYILIRSLNAGRTSAEFRVEGAEAAIDEALANCMPKRSRTAQR